VASCGVTGEGADDAADASAVAVEEGFEIR
jgi:hypothetical protein